MNIKKILAVAASGILCVGLLAGCSKSNVPSGVGNTSGNITNLGGQCEVDGRVYYQSTDGYKLCSSNSDGSDEKQLNDAESYFINVLNGYIYYCDATDGNYYIHRMKTDGTEDTVLVESACYNLTATDKGLFYTNYDDGQSVYRAELDGSNPEKIIKDVCYWLSVYDGKLYYVNASDGYLVYSAELDGTNKSIITKKSAAYINVVDGYVYYTNNPAPKDNSEDEDDSSQTSEGDCCIYRVNIETGKNERLNKKPCGDINVVGNKIYYSEWTSGNNTIGVLDLSNDEDKTLVEVSGAYINVTSNTLSYISKDDSGNLVLNRMNI
jgi:hypothetical protein